MADKPVRGDCVEYMTTFDCGCPSDGEWDCDHDNNVPHGLQRTFRYPIGNEETCGKPDCPSKRDSKSHSRLGQEKPILEHQRDEFRKPQNPQPGDCVKLISKFTYTCGCAPEWSWDCHNDAKVEHGLQQQIEYTTVEKEACDRKDCPGAKSGSERKQSRQLKGKNAVIDKRRTTACLQYVMVLPCGHKDPGKWNCSHPIDMEHDADPDIEEVRSNAPCKQGCSGEKSTTSGSKVAPW